MRRPESLVRVDDLERVAVRIPKEEERRHRTADPDDGFVDVGTFGNQRRMVSVDVIRGQADARVDAR